MPSGTSICKTILPNGLRILTEQVPYVESVSIGIWVMVGSRDEDESRRGFSHFIEHMLFKGTDMRTARQIADEMDYLGGHLNAFTDKEYTCFYVKVLSEHSEKALEVLGDMMLNSVFDAEEIEREKNVVIEEIKRHLDTPEELVHDLIPEVVLEGHALGNSVIGTEKVITSLTRDDIVGFLNEFYRPDSIIISAAGSVEHDKFVDMVAGKFGGLTGCRPPRKLLTLPASVGNRMVSRSTEQVHFCLGTKGCDLNDERRYILATVDCALGGGMSSRLFQEIRENRGLAYSIGSYAVSYQDTGLFMIYGGTALDSFEQVLQLIYRECQNIIDNSITAEELERGRNQIRAALVLGQESMSNRMSRLAKSEICYGRIINLDDVITAMAQVTTEEVKSLASDVLQPDNFALAAIGEFEEKPEWSSEE